MILIRVLAALIALGLTFLVGFVVNIRHYEHQVNFWRDEWDKVRREHDHFRRELESRDAETNKRIYE